MRFQTVVLLHGLGEFMKRMNQVILVASFIPFCWFAFMAVHELGHVVAGLASGGTVNKVVLHPLAISRTDVEPNPYPLLTVWAGPIVGILMPIGVWMVFCALKFNTQFLAQFFAGFCLVANGAYIAVGSLYGIGDAGVMLENGTPIWALWLFGIVTAPIGFVMWNGLGPKFGMGESKGIVDGRISFVSAVLLAITLFAMLLFNQRF